MAEHVVPPSNTNNESNNGSDSDQDFEPTAEMMVDDYDDERTMAEEEELEDEDDEDDEDELEQLRNEQDMPIDKLKEMFGYDSAGAPLSLMTGDVSPSDDETDNEQDVSKDDSIKDGDDGQAKDDKDGKESNDKKEITHKLLTRSSRTAQLLRGSASRESTDDEDDEEFNGEEYWRKTIQVGSSFQADIPETFLKYDDALPYENEDVMQWEPGSLDDQMILDFYEKWHINANNGLNGDSEPLPMGNHVHDDERALWLLLQCGFNVDEALRRQKIGGANGGSGSFINGDCEMTPWSEEECRHFEAGLRLHGKDFHTIKTNKLTTRSVKELVNFYYLWKKTERHDVFTSRTRLEKKKYALHPGTTDYMDKFLDEQEALISRASSPGESVTKNTTGGKNESSSSANNNTIAAPTPAIPSPQPIATQPVT